MAASCSSFSALRFTPVQSPQQNQSIPCSRYSYQQSFLWSSICALRPHSVLPMPMQRSRNRICARLGVATTAVEQDTEYMRLCVELARCALGKTSPNPLVGCVLVKDGEIVGRGFHPKAGEPHAEVFALREAGANAAGATAYVSLEPCNHFGRTPPCSQALVRAKVKRVVVGTMDPNPLVAGKGLETLRRAGIEVVVGVEDELCRATNEAFFHRILTGKPFVCLRFSMSIDGGFVNTVGAAKPELGSFHSQQLQEYDAVVITEAAVSDNPVLLSSEPGAKQPLRVVLARSLDVDLDAHVFDTSLAPTLVIADEKALLEDVQSTSKLGGQSVETLLRQKNVDVVTVQELDLDKVLGLCCQRGVCSVLLDSRGPDKSGVENFLGKQAMEESILQKVSVVVAPLLFGEKRTGPGFQIDDDSMRLERLTTRKCGEHVVIEGYFHQ